MTKLKANVEVEVTPAMLAEMFWDMDGDEQATFFNHLAENVNAILFDNQMDSMSQFLNGSGRAYIGIMYSATKDG